MKLVYLRRAEPIHSVSCFVPGNPFAEGCISGVDSMAGISLGHPPPLVNLVRRRACLGVGGTQLTYRVDLERLRELSTALWVSGSLSPLSARDHDLRGDLLRRAAVLETPRAPSRRCRSPGLSASDSIPSFSQTGHPAIGRQFLRGQTLGAAIAVQPRTFEKRRIYVIVRR